MNGLGRVGERTWTRRCEATEYFIAKQNRKGHRPWERWPYCLYCI